MYMSVLSLLACRYMHHICAVPDEGRNNDGFCESGVTDGCEHQMGAGNQNLASTRVIYALTH